MNENSFKDIFFNSLAEFSSTRAVTGRVNIAELLSYAKRQTLDFD